MSGTTGYSRDYSRPDFALLMALPKRLLALVVVSVGSLFAINSLLEQSTVAVQSTSTGEGTAQLNRLHNQHKMLLGRFGVHVGVGVVDTKQQKAAMSAEQSIVRTAIASE